MRPRRSPSRALHHGFGMLAALVWLELLPISASAQVVGRSQAEPSTTATGVRRALIICGLPGDDEHRKLFAETVEKLYAGLANLWSFRPEDMAVWFSGEAAGSDGPALKANRGAATREQITETIGHLEKALQPDDALWVFILGHAHYDGRLSWLNLPGPDMNQVEFGKLFAGLSCREQVIFLTTPASGFFIKPLAAPGRIVISATEADVEVNETLFQHNLAKALADPPAPADIDLDGDGRRTFLDVYLWAARETAREYAANELLATEHSLLDDNGDGRGTEVQIDYLPSELGGRLRGAAKPVVRAGDGKLARGILAPRPAADGAGVDARAK